MARFKKIIFFFLLFVFLCQAASIFALEINWPSLPGAQSPGEGQTIGSFFKYFLTLFFFISLSVCVVLVVVGGISYFFSGAKPAAKIYAKNQLTSAFTGLLILVCSYLILYAINPELTVFKTTVKAPPSSPAFVYKGEASTVTFGQVSLGEALDRTIAWFGKKTHIDPATGIVSSAGKELYQGQVPLFRIQKLLDEAIAKTEELQKEFKKCQCGMSKFHTEKQSALKYQCEGGMSDKAEQDFLGKKAADANADAKSPSLLEQAREKARELLEGEQIVCQTRCGNCGTGQDVAGKDPDEETKGTVNPDRTCNFAKLKELRADLEKILADLQAQKIKLSTEQMAAVENTLRENVGQFLFSGAESPVFQADFEDIKKEAEEKALQVQTVLPPIMLPAGQVHMSPASTDPLTIFVYLKDETAAFVPAWITEKNKEIWKEAQRASLTTVLMGLALEEVGNLVNDCLKAAFGNTDFQISQEDLRNFIEQSFKEGMTDYLIESLLKAGSTIASRMKDETVKSIDDAQVSKEKCAEACGENLGCIKGCDAYPPNFFTILLSRVITADIKEVLPEEIKTILESELRRVIFSKELNKTLDEDLVDILDRIFEGALTKSIEEQIPGLTKTLNEQVQNVLPDLVGNVLSQIDGILARQLPTFRETVNKSIDKLAGFLGDKLAGAAGGLISGARYDYFQCQEIFKYGYKWEPGSWTADELKTLREIYDSLGQDVIIDWESWKEALRKGECQKMTPEEINDEIQKGVDAYRDGYDENGAAAKIYLIGESGWKDGKEFCKKSGFSWNGKKMECQENPWVNLPTDKDELKRWMTEAKIGLINFGENFVQAVVKTLTYSLTKYLQVLVEDEIINPYLQFNVIEPLTDFQKDLHKFLTSTLKQLLPKQIASYLESNIENIIADICQKAKTGQEIKLYNGGIYFSEGERAKVEEYACAIDEHFHKSILDEISESGDTGKAIKDALEKKVAEYLPKDWQTFLNKSLAEILWKDLDKATIEKIITASPKGLVCGEIPAVPVFSGGDVSLKVLSTITIAGETVNNPTIKTICDEVFKKDVYGLFPYFSQTAWDKLSQAQKDFYEPVCHFVWYGCGNPFSVWQQKKLGDLTKTVLSGECSEVKTKCGQNCADCPAEDKEIWENKCRACQVLVDNSVAYSVFYYGITEAAKDQSWNDTKETETYKYLLAIFPQLEQEIKKVADKRKNEGNWTGVPDWKKFVEQAQKIQSEQAYNNLSSIAPALITLISKNKTVKEAMVSFPLWVMKYLRGESWAGDNFLSRSPYQLLHDDVCFKITNDFKKDFPEWTSDKVGARLRAQLPSAQPYTVESFETVTLADILQAILDNEAIPLERRTAYLSCLVLDQKPAETFGIAQKMINYLYPKPYRILFGLINDKLYSYERPDALNKLLSILFNDTPVSVLRKLGAGTAANFLDTYPRDYLRQPALTMPFADLICQALDVDCSKHLGIDVWEDVQEILAETPVNLAQKYLTSTLVPQGTVPVGSPMDWATSKEPILANAILDSLGNWTGLTGLAYSGYVKIDELRNTAGRAASAGVTAIQEAADKAFLDAPQAAFQWAIKGIGNLIGLKIGEQTADAMAGWCREAGGAAECKTGELFNETYKECCSLGLALACEPQCREKPADEECKVVAGEQEKTQGSKTYCCYDNKCSRCRQLTGQNCREGEDKPRAVAANLKLCCLPRDKKPSQGEDWCCVNVMECIQRKIADYLTLLVDELLHGTSLTELKSK